MRLGSSGGVVNPEFNNNPCLFCLSPEYTYVIYVCVYKPSVLIIYVNDVY